MKLPIFGFLSALLVFSGIAPGAAIASDVVAKVGSEQITLEELEEHLKGQLIELETRRYELLKAGLEQLISKALVDQEASARQITVTELYAQEVHSKLVEPSETELEELYEANKADLDGESYETIRPQLVNYLKRQQASEVLDGFLASLRDKHKPDILLQPVRVDVGVGDQPSRGGGDDAMVTIVGFSDYECPYCKNGEAVMEEILEHYGDKVRYFHRDFPLSFHPNAHGAAQASRCAGDQGKFWEYHAALFASSRLSQDVFRSLADDVGLERVGFDECLASGKFKEAVDKDMSAGAEVGVNGTPSFFVNGRVLSGAQTLDDFRQVIDGEIKSAKN